MSDNMKGQASSEMLMSYSVLLLAFLVSFSLLGGQVQSIAYAKNSMEAFRLGSGLGSAIDAVFIAGKGTVAVIDTGQKNATIIIDNRMLRVTVGNSPYEWSLLTNSTSASNVSPGAIRIRNSNGAVSIENI